jgi:hypothetical protein
MYTRYLSLIVILFAFSYANVVYAGQSGMDSKFIQFINIDSTDPTTPNVINTVSVTCPLAGQLISTASGQISMNISGSAGEVDIQYGISKNSLAQDINHHHLLRQYTDSGTTWGTAHYQRIDSCTAGQTVTLRFVAHRLSAASADAQKASLVVLFVEGPRI